MLPAEMAIIWPGPSSASAPPSAPSPFTLSTVLLPLLPLPRTISRTLRTVSSNGAFTLTVTPDDLDSCFMDSVVVSRPGRMAMLSPVISIWPVLREESSFALPATTSAALNWTSFPALMMTLPPAVPTVLRASLCVVFAPCRVLFEDCDPMVIPNPDPLEKTPDFFVFFMS